MQQNRQLQLPLGTQTTIQAPSSMDTTSRKSKNDRNSLDRVFVPLSSGPYSWFESGEKTWELRKAERQFTEAHLRPGREVELRRGYSDASTALWGQIVEVIRAKTLEEFFQKVPHTAVIPGADSKAEAIMIAKSILKLEDSAGKDVIGFEVKLREPIKIPLKAEFIPLVRSGSKTSTIRAGRRTIGLGPADIICGNDEVPVSIVNVSFKQVSNISDKDAQNDGFESRELLMDKLRSIYSNIKDDDIVTLIQFAVR